MGICPKISLKRGSPINLRREYENYAWKVNKDGETRWMEREEVQGERLKKTGRDSQAFSIP